MEVYAWRVRDSEKDARLAAYVEKSLPLIPVRYIREAFQKKDVKVDGVRAKADDRVLPGTEIRVFTPFRCEIPVVYEDENVLLIHKPAGLCVEDEYCGMSVISLMEKKAKGVYRPRLCHRLDTQTSGLLLLAKTDESEQVLLTAFKERTLKKEYEFANPFVRFVLLNPFVFEKANSAITEYATSLLRCYITAKPLWEKLPRVTDIFLISAKMFRAFLC